MQIYIQYNKHINNTFEGMQHKNFDAMQFFVIRLRSVMRELSLAVLFSSSSDADLVGQVGRKER